MNDRVLDLFPGDVVACLSVDTVAEVDQQAVYPVPPVEYLNSQSERTATTQVTYKDWSTDNAAEKFGPCPRSLQWY